jgi:hypothetical protein
MRRLSIGWDSNHGRSFLIPLMVIDDLYFRWPIAGPTETDPVSLVNSNTVLTFPVSSKGLKMIPRRNPQFVEPFDRVQLVQFTASDRPKIAGAALPRWFCIVAVEQIFRALVTEGPNHLNHGSMDRMLSTMGPLRAQHGISLLSLRRRTKGRFAAGLAIDVRDKGR